MKMNYLYYTLDEQNQPVPCDLMTYARWFENNIERRVVKRTPLPDGVTISTVFLGLNHAYGDEPPILFETMIFGGDHDGFQERYHTWSEAERGHEEAIQLAFTS